MIGSSPRSPSTSGLSTIETMVLTFRYQILRLFLIGSIISSSVQPMCLKPTRRLDVALVTESQPSKAISEVFDLQSEIGVFNMSTENGMCYEMVVRSIFVDHDRQNGIYDPTLKSELEKSDLMIGQYFKSVESYANSMGKYYIVAEPPNLRQEKERPGNFTLSVWPSYTLFIGAVKSNVELYFKSEQKIETQKVTIVTYTESENGIEVLAALEKSLHKSERLLTTITLDKTLKILESNQKVRFHPSRIYDTLKPVRRKLQGVNVVVLYLDTNIEKKIEILRLVLGKAADLYEEDKVWLLADMVFPYQGGAFTNFSNFSVLKSEVYYMKFEIGDLTIQKSCLERDVGVVETGLEIIKRILDDTGPQIMDDSILNGLMKYFVLNDSYSDTYQLAYFPRDVNMKTVWLKPNIFYKWYLYQPSFTFCGLLRSQFRHENYYIADYDWDKETGQLFFYDKDFFLQGLTPYRQSFTVLVLEAMPFVRQKPNGEFEGMAIEIFNAVQLEMHKSRLFLNFKFELRKVYGSKVDGQWNGIFHELGILETEDGLRNDKVLGLGMISKTPERSAEFEFTSPVYESYITYTVYRRHNQNMFQFLTPFTVNVWLALLGVCIVSAVTMYLFHAWNPFQTEIDSQHSLPLDESLWHSFLIITHTGAPFGLLTAPNRIFTMSFCFFALVIVGSYTGNLASFLSHSTLEVPLQSLTDVLLNSPRRVSAIANSSISDFIRKHREDSRVDDSDFVMDYDQGLEKVRTEDYIFVGSYPGLRYHETHDADNSIITHTERASEKRSDEIAFPIQHGWEYKDDFRSAFDRVSERGEMQKIVHKWLDIDAVLLSTPTNDQERLGIETSLGIVVVLGISAIIAYFCLALKLVYIKMCKMGEDKVEVEQKEHENNVETYNNDEAHSISNGTLDSALGSVSSQIDMTLDCTTRL